MRHTGGFGVRGDLNQVEPLVVSDALSLRHGVDAQLRSVETDQTAFTYSDLVR